MSKKIPFVDKFIKRLDRLDQQAIQTQMMDLVRENSLYEEVMDELHDGILIVKGDGSLRFANRQAILWLDLPVRGQLKIQEQIADKDLADFIASRLETSQDRAVADFRILAPKELHIRAILLPLAHSQERETLVILSNLISAEKTSPRKEDALSRIQSLLKLAGGIAHEIGNPLNSIAIHLALMQKKIKELPESKRGFFEKTLDVLHTETRRLDKIVQGFLKATRKPPLRFKSDALNAILEEAVAVFVPELKKHHILTELKLDTTIPLFLMDRERLYQAFVNLIKNAQEAMPKGGKFEIHSHKRGNAAVLQFKDQGVGIKAEDLPHIFEAYYTTKSEGSGLGLMNVFNAVNEHGGRIEVTSKPGKGSTFTILLPIRQPKFQLPEYKIK